MLSHPESDSNTFIKIISHELRTPMQGVITSVDLVEALIEDSYTGDQAEMANALSRMRSAIEMMRVQLRDLAVYAKTTNSSLLIRSEPFLPSETLEKIIGGFRPVAAAKNISLSISVDPNDPILLIGDQSRLAQILVNLTDNAIKYTTKGGVVIRLSSADNNVLLEIIDDGIGILDEELTAIRQPFKRGSNVPIQIKGSGLGLSIVDKLTGLMGGSLEISRRPEGGTVARVSLPKYQPCPKLKRFLLVSSEATHGLLATLNQAIYSRPLWAQTGQAGMQIAITNRNVGLVAIDIDQSDMNGIDVAKQIRAKTGDQSPLLIALAEANSLSDEQRELFNTVLERPISQEVFLTTVRTLLAQQCPVAELTCPCPGGLRIGRLAIPQWTLLERQETSKSSE